MRDNAAYEELPLFAICFQLLCDSEMCENMVDGDDCYNDN